MFGRAARTLQLNSLDAFLLKSRGSQSHAARFSRRMRCYPSDPPVNLALSCFKAIAGACRNLEFGSKLAIISISLNGESPGSQGLALNMGA